MFTGNLLNISELKEGEMIRLYTSENNREAKKIVLKMQGTKACAIELLKDNTAKLYIFDTQFEDVEFECVMDKDQLYKLVMGCKEINLQQQ
ncbi:hypothetical protein PMX22_21660 [Clostridium butyricum]|jgi:hypothetical protein|uniref:hypothetical protein n=1 Tax=Clostridium butyricum TaxID=1492 RepID=UPI00204AF475|nr:hypothetical protein [Clostridium butyricum]MDB2162391.1 hypothetical protein [Clostridium butyricum]DAQ97686.1 MAG TPA: hypothetical protein [Caudoviricetes sp.]